MFHSYVNVYPRVNNDLFVWGCPNQGIDQQLTNPNFWMIFLCLLDNIPIFCGSNSSLLLVEFTMFDDEISIFDGMFNGSIRSGSIIY